jgi:hypothetical protein
MEKIKTLEPYYSRNRLQEHDELKLNYTIFWMKQKAMEL